MKSIDLFDKKAVGELEKQIYDMALKIEKRIPKFCSDCLDWIMKRANEYLDTSQFDAQLVTLIKDGWIIMADEKGATLENLYNKATYVEFGTGIIGGDLPHPSSGQSGYEYDMNSHGQKGWTFKIPESEPLDVRGGSLTDAYPDTEGGYIIVHTSGQEGELFLYKAMLDFMADEVYNKIFANVMNEVMQ